MRTAVIEKQHNGIEIGLCWADKKEKQLMINMFSLYLHDLSEYTDHLYMDENGLFQCHDIDLFWDNEKYIPYFITIGKQVIGFVILLRGHQAVLDNYDFDFYELFILRQYRKMGIGKFIAQMVFELHPGLYNVSVLIRNTRAINFWRKLYSNNGDLAMI